MKIKEFIPWIAIILMIFAVNLMSAQFSLEGAAGINSYKEPGSYSSNMVNLQGAVSYTWLDGYVTTRVKGYYGTLESNHEECFYDTDYWGTGIDMMASLNKVMHRTSNYLVIKPFVGAGYANYGGNGVLTLDLGTQINVSFTKSLWGTIEFSRSGLVGLDQTMYNYSITSKEVDAINDKVMVGIRWALPGKKSRIQRWGIRDEGEVSNKSEKQEDSCIECVTPPAPPTGPVYAIPSVHILFDEGQWEPLNIDAGITVIDHLERNPNTNVRIHTYACTNQGTPERNFEITRLRAEAVKAYFIDAGIDPSRIKLVPHGAVGERFTGKKQAAQRRASFEFFE